MQLYGGGSGNIGKGRLVVGDSGELEVQVGAGGTECGGHTTVQADHSAFTVPGGYWSQVSKPNKKQMKKNSKVLINIYTVKDSLSPGLVGWWRGR